MGPNVARRPRSVISLLVTGPFHSTEGAAINADVSSSGRTGNAVDIRRLAVTSEQWRPAWDECVIAVTRLTFYPPSF